MELSKCYMAHFVKVLDWPAQKSQSYFNRTVTIFKFLEYYLVFHPSPLPTNSGYLCYPILPNKRVGVKDQIWVLDSRSFFEGQDLIGV